MFRCNVVDCNNKTFASEESLRLHLAMHREEKLSHRCNICSDKFSTADKLREHQQFHDAAVTAVTPRPRTPRPPTYNPNAARKAMQEKKRESDFVSKDRLRLLDEQGLPSRPSRSERDQLLTEIRAALDDKPLVCAQQHLTTFCLRQTVSNYTILRVPNKLPVHVPPNWCSVQRASARCVTPRRSQSSPSPTATTSAGLLALLVTSTMAVECSCGRCSTLGGSPTSSPWTSPWATG